MKMYATLLVLLFFVAAARAEQVNLLAMGDWGSNDKGQAAVAADMAHYIKSASCNFDGMLLAGDNFYVPLQDGIRDAKWNKMFEDLYAPAIFQFPFYVALGNHDYLGDRYMVEFAYAQGQPRISLENARPLVSP